MTARALALLLAAGTACMVGSCSSTDVILATLPAGDDAGTGHGPLRCSGNDCPAGSYCEKSSCDALSGTCQFYPVDCGDAGPPECGCDGITYFDDCLRRENGIASFVPGPCWQGNAMPCGGPDGGSCPPGAVCSLLQGRECSPDAEGSCWVIPLQCPASEPGSDRWDSCAPGQECVDTCTALKTGGPHRRAMMCH